MSNKRNSHKAPKHLRSASCPKIKQLLQQSINIVSSSLSMNHVLVLELDPDTYDEYLFASIGWDRADSLRIGKQIINWSLQSATDELISHPDDFDSRGEIFTLSSAYLTAQRLDFGAFITVPCRKGRLVMLAGRSGSGFTPGHPEVVSLHAVMKILNLALVSAHAEQSIQSDLQQYIDLQHQHEISLAARTHLMCLLDDEGHVLQINRACEQWDLGDGDSLRGKHVHRLLHPDCVERNCKLLKKWKEQWLQLASTEVVACDFQDPSLGCDYYCFVIKCRQYADRQNTEAHALLIMEDFSLHKSAEKMLDSYNEKCMNMHTEPLSTSLSGYCVTRNDQPIYCNDRFAVIFEYCGDEICKLNMHQLIPSDRSEATAGFNGIIHENYWMSEEQIVKGVSHNGNPLWLLRCMTTVDCLEDLTSLIRVVEVPTHMEKQQILRLSKSEFPLISRILIESQEEERKRISRELHDSIGQSISAIKLRVEIALRECAGSMPKTSINYLTGAIDILSATMDDVRRISMNLRPSMLDDIGLIATIGWFCREYRPLIPDVELTVQINVVESDIPEILKIVIFRILQESLNNIGKHAFASKVHVELSMVGDLLTFHIEDDGRGFVADAISMNQGFGLGSMRQRAKNSGGTLVVAPGSNGGTAMHAAWQCDLQ